MKIETIGSVCSGIGAAAYSWSYWNFKWFAEIEEFQSKVLKYHYPKVQNLGDMKKVPNLLNQEQIPSVDMICGGTPCQAFSLAGLKQGLEDERGNLTLEFIKVVEENDNIRLKKGEKRAVVLWENVEGVFSDKTNALGYLLAGLAGFDEPVAKKDIQKSGYIKGLKRNLAWRVLDSKFFGSPQQRKRLFLLAGDTDFMPENVLFEELKHNEMKYPASKLEFLKDGVEYEVFRSYTDTLYSAYGTKWNGNSAAYNGSLFVAQDGELRRFSPLEAERIMGFPDNYTNIEGASRTKRYQAVGNSWSIPVIEWIGTRLQEYEQDKESILNIMINSSTQPNDVAIGNLKNIVAPCDLKKLYLSPVAAAGILRRSNEREMNLNESLKKHLIKIKNRMPIDKINKESLRQKRGDFSKNLEEEKNALK